MTNCEYIFRCSYEFKGKEPICKNNIVSCHCEYWQGLKAEDVSNDSLDLLANSKAEKFLNE